MQELRGLPVANAITEKLQKELEEFKSTPQYQGRVPKLGIVRIGERGDDLAYERGAKSRMEKVGFEYEVFAFAEDIAEDEFLKEFDKINANPEIDGILLFRPMPKSIDEKKVIAHMDPKKDLDGITPMNEARVFEGSKEGYAPCTAEAVIAILDHAGVDLTGKRAVVVGRSMVIGRPVAMMLMQKNATVTITHTKTVNRSLETKRAEVLVAAAGRAKTITAEDVSEGAVVIDVGINVDAEGNLCGDVDFDGVKDIASMITPVPRGVGSVTTSILAEHLMRAARLR